MSKDIDIEAIEYMEAAIRTPPGGNTERTIKKMRAKERWKKRLITRLNRNHTYFKIK